jgi:hypothetical protein
MKTKILSTFFSSQSLYTPTLIYDNYVNPIGVESPFDFQETTFSYLCAQEQEVRTFEIELPKSSIDFWSGQPGNIIPKELLSEGKLDFTHHFVGVCRSCKIYHVDFLVRVWSTESISTDLLRVARRGHSIHSKSNENESEKFNSIYVEKIGVNPQVKPLLDKEMTKHFDRETNNWYFKGKKAMSESLGIGAFAYFRRIIEKELFSIVNDI